MPDMERDMSSTDIAPRTDSKPTLPLGWRELWLKEDWWAVWLGVGTVIIAYLLFANGNSIGWIAVTPAKWATFQQLGADFAVKAPRTESTTRKPAS